MKQILKILHHLPPNPGGVGETDRDGAAEEIETEDEDSVLKISASMKMNRSGKKCAQTVFLIKMFLFPVKLSSLQVALLSEEQCQNHQFPSHPLSPRSHHSRHNHQCRLHHHRRNLQMIKIPALKKASVTQQMKMTPSIIFSCLAHPTQEIFSKDTCWSQLFQCFNWWGLTTFQHLT